MAAYTDAAAIAAKLGATFTPSQAAQADVVAEAVTAWIDHTTGQSWQGTSPTVGELHAIIPPRDACYGAAATVYLLHRPCLAVSAVRLRAAYANAPESAVDPSDYELIDAANGVLALNAAWSALWYGTSMLAAVDYSFAAVVPADIAYAATVLAADFMTTTLAPESAGVESIAVARNDISIKYAGSTGNDSADVKAARSVVESYRLVVIA